MKRLLLGALVMMSLTAMAQPTAREQIATNPYLSGSNHLDYDRSNTFTMDAKGRTVAARLTPAPKGYEPYLMNHYGRHGARWLLGDSEYSESIEILTKAQAQGKTTALADEVLTQLKAFYPCTVNRLGDLTTVGERQHHGIGRRMAANFPEIFKKKGVHIDAKSTVVFRCILSMEAECEELAAANPTARIHNDVGEVFQYYLNAPWPQALRQQDRKRWEVMNKYREQWTKPERLMSTLFNDPQWVADSIKAGSFMRHFFNLASNMQSHDGAPNLLPLFTTDELYDQWRLRNAEWYMGYGHAPQTGGIMPFSQAALLRDIIQVADTAKQTQAVLRFGHEICVMPLACLLELGNCGARVDDLEQLDRTWRNYDIFPMGCNIQLIFYRPKKGRQGDILVKVLLNEREQTLPVPTDQHPYYRWADLRDYYQHKLDDFNQMKSEK